MRVRQEEGERTNERENEDQPERVVDQTSTSANQTYLVEKTNFFIALLFTKYWKCRGHSETMSLPKRGKIEMKEREREVNTIPPMRQSIQRKYRFVGFYEEKLKRRTIVRTSKVLW